MRIYLDACCLNRPFDDQAQDRIRLEAEAVLLIVRRFYVGQWQWISSEILDFELERTSDRQRRLRTHLVAAFAHHSVNIEDADVERGQHLESLGFHEFDALHLACAESGGADIFLTTDDKLYRLAQRQAKHLRVKVCNPVTWLKEIEDQ